MELEEVPEPLGGDTVLVIVQVEGLLRSVKSSPRWIENKLGFSKDGSDAISY
jgi:hypothetical protein